MPIIEYECLKCKAKFETLGEKEKSCPECNSEKVRRLISPCNHQWKGAKPG